MKQAVASQIMIFKEFISHPKKMSMITSSSLELTQTIIKENDIAQANVIVELGPGTGAFTEKINQYKKKQAVFFCLESNDTMASYLKNNVSDTHIFHDDAKKIDKYLKLFNKEECDCVISSIPWASLSEGEQIELLDIIVANIKKGGVFTTYAYIHTKLFSKSKRFKKLLQNLFSIVSESKIVWKNIPPAVVYHCRR